MSRNFLMASAACIVAALFGVATPAFSQGIIPGKPQPEDLSGSPLSSLTVMTPQEVATVQRLLVRMGYLQSNSLNRSLDGNTVAAISAHLSAVGWIGPSPNSEQLIRSLFGEVWKAEGWADGLAAGQRIIVEKEDVRLAQEALKNLNGAPGPLDGIFGPATFAAVETFQAENGLKVTGLLTRNTFNNIMRAAKFAGSQPKSTVRILAATGVVDPAALESFEVESGIRVVEENYENSSETKSLLMQGSDSYDLMVQAGGHMRQVLEKENAVTKIDRVRLPNSLKLDTASQVYTEALDPLNAHSIPYLWGTVGLGINRDKVLRLAPDAPINSMALLLDPKYAALLSQCGLAMIDEPIDVIPSIVSYLGGDFRNVGITDLEAVDGALAQVRSHIDVVTRAKFVEGLASGKYCATIGFSGDVLTAREQAKVKQTAVIGYSVPKEGSELWFQLLVIPKNAMNPDASYLLIDHLLKPEVAAAGTKSLMYANTVWGAGPLMEASLLEDPGLYPPRDVMGRLSIQPPLSADVEAELNRIWAKLKKG
jgi:putrescine transport system substrate-binding protein